MILEDLLEKDVKAMTDDELESYISLMSRLKISREEGPKTSVPRSNKDKQVDDLLSKLPPEKLAKLLEMLGG